MSTIASSKHSSYVDEAGRQQVVPLGAWTPGYIERSPMELLAFVPALLFTTCSWLAGGIQPLTDLGFIALAVAMIALLLSELAVFPQRFGVGGIVLYSGTLIWFCYDYFTRWIGYQGGAMDDAVLGVISSDAVSVAVLAKSACIHVVFLFSAAIALHFRKGMVVSRLCFKCVEPRSASILFVVILIIFFLSIIPYLFFTQEGFLTTMRLVITGGYTDNGPTWTTGRSGNINYNWGGYLAQLVSLGYVGGTLAGVHALMFTRSSFQKLICWMIFFAQGTLAFGTGARGHVLMVCLPIAFMLFLKYNFQAGEMAKRVSIRAFVAVTTFMFLLLFVIQVQGWFRELGFEVQNFADVEVSTLRGNEMFTTTLPGMTIFPDRAPFLDAPFPFAGALYALPKTLYWFAVGPIPRAAWHNKPIDPLWSKYNSIVAGRSEDDHEGTTISRGGAGEPYFRYGMMGVLQIGCLFGWLLRNAEVGIRSAQGKPVAFIALLGLLAFMFRSFRDLNFHSLYPVIYTCMFMSLICIVFNIMASDERFRGSEAVS